MEQGVLRTQHVHFSPHLRFYSVPLTKVITMYSVIAEWQIRKALTMSSCWGNEKNAAFISTSNAPLPFYVAVIDLNSGMTFRFYDPMDYDGSEDDEE